MKTYNERVLIALNGIREGTDRGPDLVELLKYNQIQTAYKLLRELAFERMIKIMYRSEDDRAKKYLITEKGVRVLKALKVLEKENIQ